MEPIVNGIAENYSAQIEVRRVDADSASGQRQFRSFGLVGHPSYIVLNPSGDVLWRGVGEQPQQTLTDQIESILREYHDG